MFIFGGLEEILILSKRYVYLAAWTTHFIWEFEWIEILDTDIIIHAGLLRY